jgi:cytochrome c peroxidase
MRGDTDFHDRAAAGLGGNGRACSDCHMDSNSFQLSPSNVEARFQRMNTTGIDDPLFRPIDADDFVANGVGASDYSNLRQNGLIRVRMPLPANIKVVDPSSCMTAGVPAPCETATTYFVSSATFTDVWRSVPSVLNVSLTGNDSQPSIWPRGPNPQGGYQLEGRVDTLQNQARGALLNHAQVATAPGEGLLDDIAVYENGLLAPAEPPLNDLETMGKAVFDRACGQCHNGPGMSTPLTGTQTILRFSDVRNACPRPVDPISPARWNLAPCPPSVARNAQTYEISFADGFKMRRTSTDPGRALLSGFVFSALPAADGSCAHAPCGPSHLDDWQKFEIAPLHGISKTAPYFHNNSAATLEDVVIHYEEFFKLSSALNPLPIMPPLLTTDGVDRDRPNVPAERGALVAYLQKL